MIKLDKLSNGGNPIVIKYNTKTSTAEFSSFANILERDGVPPSKYAPENADAVGGLYDHIFGFNRDSFTSTNRWLSVESIKPTTTQWWTNFGEVIVGEIEGNFGGDLIWMVITEMEYVNLEPVSTVKVTIHFGVDIYMV